MSKECFAVFLQEFIRYSQHKQPSLLILTKVRATGQLFLHDLQML